MWANLRDGTRTVGTLSATALAKLDQPGRHADGGGQDLFVDSEQRRYWLLRFMIGGRRRDMAIGPERNVSPAKARETAMTLRLPPVQGLDPLEACEAAEIVCRQQSWSSRCNEPMAS
jgi:hypothetical protein